MTINIFKHIYIGENAHWDNYAPPLAKALHNFFFKFFYFFFHFRCILLQISHQKCFFISISIPGRSGVKFTLAPVSTRMFIFVLHNLMSVVGRFSSLHTFTAENAY